MADHCLSCGTQLGFFQRLRGGGLCPACAERKRLDEQEAREQYQRLIRALEGATSDPEELAKELPGIAASTGLAPAELERLNLDAFRAFLLELLADDHLSVDQEQRMNRVASALAIEQQTFVAKFGDLPPRLFVARANAGRLPSLSSSRIMLRRNEVAHMDANADLLKEVVDREWQGRSSGFSFRVTRGVRYRIGSSRGHMVVLGSHLAVDDSGFLTITSQRAVFTGARRSLEMPYGKLLNLEMFGDGVRFHLSNRKAPALFRLKAGIADCVASAINAAVGAS